MPTCEYSKEHNAWIKECASCKKVFVGAEHLQDAEKVLQEFFDKHYNTIDGLQFNCKQCHRYNRRRRSGMDHHDEDAMFKDQDGKCALCAIEIFKPYRYPADPQGARIDHCHSTGKIRGLLCHGCNILVGMYEAVVSRSPTFNCISIDDYIGQ